MKKSDHTSPQASGLVGIVLSVCLVCGAPADGAAGRRAFEAVGHVVEKAGTAEPEFQGRVVARYDFSVRGDGERWLMTVRSGSPGLKGVRTYGCDGVDCYLTHVISPEEMSFSPDVATNPAAMELERERMRRGLLPQGAEVTPGVIPRRDPWLVRHLWMAFCAGEVLRSITPEEALERFYADRPVLKIENRIGWRFHEKDPLLIAEYWTLSLGIYDAKQKRLTAYAPPFHDKVLTSFLYRVVETAQVGGSLVPRRFEMAGYLPWYAPGTTNAASGRVYEGIVDEIRPLRGGVSGRPPLDRLFEVTDHRAAPMNEGKPLVYWTHREWWQTNETRFVRALQGIFEEEKPAGLSRWTVWAAFGLLVGLYGAGLWVSRKVRRRQAGSGAGGGG